MVATLRRHCAELAEQHCVDVAFSATGNFDSLSDVVSLCPSPLTFGFHLNTLDSSTLRRFRGGLKSAQSRRPYNPSVGPHPRHPSGRL